MDPEPITKEHVESEINRLATEYRAMCLWFTPRNYLPTTYDERLATLRDIERYGDREAFKRARELRHWLLQTSKSG
jgi:hypothetical protein